MPDYDSRNIPILDDVIDDTDLTDDDEIIDLSNIANFVDDDDNFDLFATGLTDTDDESSLPHTDNFIDEYEDSDSADPVMGNLDALDALNRRADTVSVDNGAYFSSVAEEIDIKINDDSDNTLSNTFDVIERFNVDVQVADTPEEVTLNFQADDDEFEETTSALINHYTDVTDELNAIDKVTALNWGDDADISLQETSEEIDDEADEDTVVETDEVFSTAINVDEITPQATASLALEIITEDIVKQIMPALEQQLRTLVQQALEEKLPASWSTSPASDDSRGE